MANEADVRRGISRDFEYYTVADGTAITKGTLMVFTPGSARTVVAHSGGGPQCAAGYAIEEKEANDGKTEIGVQISGLVEAAITSGCLAGDLLMPDATANKLTLAAGSTTGAISGAFLRCIIGTALDNAAANGVVTVKLGRVVD